MLAAKKDVFVFTHADFRSYNIRGNEAVLLRTTCSCTTDPNLSLVKP